MNPTIVWFRQDLRLQDNPALQAAVARGGAESVLRALIQEVRAAVYWNRRYEPSAVAFGQLRARRAVA